MQPGEANVAPFKHPSGCLHRTDLMIGRGRSLGDPDDEDSISPSALERVALAGARYRWFAGRVRDAEGA